MTFKGSLRSPFLREISLLSERVSPNAFPFDRFPRLLCDGFALAFNTPVTLFVGENGTGKSTFLEAIAALCGFNVAGGSSQHMVRHEEVDDRDALAEALRPSWLPRVSKGFFFRSETFAEVSRYIDEIAAPDAQGGRGLAVQSHGEALFSVLANRFDTMDRCMFLLDEPENALSPNRQLAFLRLIRRWEETGNAQIIIATHSPIILSYPGATLYAFDGERITSTTYEETEHYHISRAFLSNPDRFLNQLFDDNQAESE